MKSILCLVAFMFATQVFSQVITSKEFEYSISNPYEVVDGRKWYFEDENSTVISVKVRRNTFFIQKFGGSSLNEIKRIDVEGLPSGSSQEDIIKMGSKIYIFYSNYDKARNSEQLFVRPFDIQSFTFEDDRKLIETDGKCSGSLYSYFSVFAITVTNKFKISLNFDENQILVQYRMIPKEKRDALNKDLIGMHTYNADLEEIWGEVVEMPYTEKKMNNVGYCVDRNSNVYILAEVYKDETTKRVTKSGEPNYDLELIKIDGANSDISSSRISLDDYFLVDYGFYEGADGKIILAGYYSESRFLKANGFFSFILEDDGTLAESSKIPFDVEVLKQFEKERTQKKLDKANDDGKLGVANLMLRDVQIDKDGSITTYGEVYRVVSHYNSKTGQTTYTYYYEEMIVSRLSPEGELVWMAKLPKYQVGGTSPGGMGFYNMSSEGYVYVLFLDNVKNLELGENELPARHSDGMGGFLTAYQVDKDSGEWKRLSVFDTKDANGTRLYQFNTNRIVPIGDNSFGVEFYKKAKEDVMIKVNLKE